LFLIIVFQLYAYRLFAVIIAECLLQLIVKHFRLLLLSVSHVIYRRQSSWKCLYFRRKHQP